MLKNLLKLILLITVFALIFQGCKDKNETEKTFTVAYDLNGGTGTAPASQSFKVGGDGITLHNGAGLTKTGFAFGGWTEKVNPTVAVANPYTPASNVTVYAIWNPVYTVIYNLNGGTGKAPASQTYTQGGTGIALNSGEGLIRSGFTFGGWAETEDGKTPITSPLKPSKNSTVYAIWNASIATYTVTYDINGGTGNTLASQTYTQGGVGITLNNGAGLIRTGFTFGGWAETTDGKTPIVSPFKPSRNSTVYAIWNASIVTYTVTYDLNGGSGTAPSPQIYTSGQGITLPTNVTRLGYTFMGWVTSTTGTTVLSSPYHPTASITLYAYWSQNAAFTLTSTTYTNGGVIPPRCSSSPGKSNTSPQLSWTGAPTANVVKYILVFFDATAIMWHFKREINTDVSNLAEGAIPSGISVSDYFGPDPGDGRPHTYQFKLYAVKSGYTLTNFGNFLLNQSSWTSLETANAAFIVGASNIYSGTYRSGN